MSDIPDDNTCHTPNHVWMQGCATCFEERIRADEREKAAQRVLAYYAESGDEIGTSLHYGLGDAARGEDACEEPLYPDDWGDK